MYSKKFFIYAILSMATTFEIIPVYSIFPCDAAGFMS